MNEQLPALNSFVLPGGGMASAWLHLARTVARRAERLLVHMPDRGDEATALRYLNRLSDWLFVAAREAARLAGQEETLWRPGDRG